MSICTKRVLLAIGAPAEPLHPANCQTRRQAVVQVPWVLRFAGPGVIRGLPNSRSTWSIVAFGVVEASAQVGDVVAQGGEALAGDFFADEVADQQAQQRARSSVA